MSPQQFTAMVIRALQALGRKLQITYDDEDPFILRIDQTHRENGVVINLAHAYYEYAVSADREQQEIIQRLVTQFKTVRGGGQPPDDYHLAEKRLGLALKTMSLLEWLCRQSEVSRVDVQRPRYVHRPLGGELVVMLIDDNDGLATFLDETRLARWQVTAGTALQSATWNLVQRGACFEQVGSVLCSRTCDGYDAARIVLVETLRKLPLKGAPVALAPDKDCLLVTGSEDIDGLRQMAEMGHVSLGKQTRPISGRPVVLIGSAWEPFEPPDAVQATFGQLARLYDVRDYRRQALALRQLHERQGDGVRIAEIVIVPSSASNQSTTMAAWYSDGPALLPVVDIIYFLDKATGNAFMASWDEAVRVLGHDMVRTQDEPLRFRVVRFPSLEELDSMQAKKISLELAPGAGLTIRA